MSMSQFSDDDLLRVFEAELSKLRFEFLKNLKDIDILNKNLREDCLTLFTQRLIIFQHQFLDYLSKLRGGIHAETVDFTFAPPPRDRTPEIASGILAAGTGALLTAFIPVGTSGVWIWASTITAAGSIGAAIGAPAGLVTAGGGLVAGLVVGSGVALFSRKQRRKLFRAELLKKFDSEIVPTLREWAQSKIVSESDDG